MLNDVPQVTLVRLDTSELAIAPLTPTTIRCGIQVTYARPDVFRHSGNDPLHYVSTEGLVVSVDFPLLTTSETEIAAAEAFQNFLLSACHPPPDDDAISAPPQVALIWPGYIDLVGVFERLDVIAELFHGDGRPKRQTITLSMAEVRVTSITSTARAELGLRLGSTTI